MESRDACAKRVLGGNRAFSSYLPDSPGDEAEAHADSSLRGHVHLRGCWMRGIGQSMGRVLLTRKLIPRRVSGTRPVRWVPIEI